MHQRQTNESRPSNLLFYFFFLPTDVATQQIPTPLPVYPAVRFQVLKADHVVLRQDSPGPQGNSSQKAHTWTFLITDPGPGLLRPVLNASYGPLSVDAPIPPELLLSGRRIVPVILGHQVRSSSPVVKILFNMPREVAGAQEKSEDGAHCVTAYAFWGTREVRGACLVSPDSFCVAELKPEPAWFGSSTRSGGSSKEAGRTEAAKGFQSNLVEVYFQSRMDKTGQCTPQDSLQRVAVGRAGVQEGSGTPMRRIGSVNLLKTPPGNATFVRLRLGGALVIQTTSKPLKSNDVVTFYVFLASTSTLESFTLRKNLLEVLQLDLVAKYVSELVETHTISWRLDQPGNVRDVGQMRIYTTQRDYVGLAPLVMSTDILNTAVLTGKVVKVPVKTLAVEASGSVTDVSSLTSCRSTDKEVSERCDFVFVTGKESRGKSRVMINFTYGFLSAQLEMSVWRPRLPLRIDVADPELNQIKGWRVPIPTSNPNEEEEEMRKGRGCMLQYQHSTLRVLTPFEADSDALPDSLTGAKPVDYFLGPDWQVDVTNLVRYSLKVADPNVARVHEGEVCYFLQVLSPLTSSVLAEKAIRVVDDKVSVMELGIQLVSGLSLSLQPSPGSSGAIVAMATTRQTITQLKQEAAVSCWVVFSDGAVVPLAVFDHNIYSLTVSTPDEAVATVRRTPQSTFVVAQSESHGQGALVRVELRICEECQKSKRKSKLAVGTGSPTTARPANTTASDFDKDGQKGGFGNMLDNPNSPPNKGNAKADVSHKKEPPKTKSPKVIESDLIRTFRSMSDLEIGIYSLVAVLCIAILGFLLNCASYRLCFRNHKTPTQAGPTPNGDPKDHKHDWVWLGMSTLTRRSADQLQRTVVDSMANRSATLLARPHRSEPLHSPTSKRNQVQFTTFTTLDIKHLAALKKDGDELIIQ
uniref:Si:dkey-1d7.3 n=1 Tax=Hippocampus comes TaxID=109280 RepID=A0A3Q2YZY2_HIPCM